jgi:CxxC motif-containing protein (DUF1111 family)
MMTPGRRKLHDITAALADRNRENLDQKEPGGSDRFFAGSGKFLTRKLWGIANRHSFGHHGLYTTMREAVLAHSGEALNARMAFQSLKPFDQDCVIEFLSPFRSCRRERRKPSSRNDLAGTPL